jgi:hypothetical protein
MRAFVLALLVAGAFAALPMGPVHAADCGGLPSTRSVQDDAGLGHDAPDVAADVPLLQGEGYAWGFLDPPARAANLDLDDWYAAQVPWDGHEVIVGVIIAAQASLPPEVPYLPEPAVYLDVWAPGATHPVTGFSGGGNLTFLGAPAGLWTFHVYEQPLAELAPCAAADAASLAQLPQQAQDYGVYFGCKPVCLPGA